MRTLTKYLCNVFLGCLFVFGMVSATYCVADQQKETVGEYVNNTAMTTIIKSRMSAQQELRDTDITVTTEHNIVHLSGEVRTPYQRNLAEKIAASVEGVESVDNAIVIKK